MIDHRTQYYIYWREAWSIPFGVASVWLLGSQHPVWGGFFLFLTVLVLTTRYGFEIDLKSKTCRKYLWMAGVKRGEFKQFQELQYLFIEKNKVNQRNGLTTATREVFSGYIKFSETENIHLASERRKDQLMEMMNKMASDLNIKIVDYTDTVEDDA